MCGVPCSLPFAEFSTMIVVVSLDSADVRSAAVNTCLERCFALKGQGE